MKTTTSRAFRLKHLNSYGPDDFESFADYFMYLHLNSGVQWIHVLGGVGTLLLLPWALSALLAYNPWPFVLFSVLFYGAGFASHWLWDGLISKTVSSFWASYACVLTLNLRVLTRQIKQDEATFMQKYPQVMWVYLTEAQPGQAYLARVTSNLT